jgi:hypothetical protein
MPRAAKTRKQTNAKRVSLRAKMALLTLGAPSSFASPPPTDHAKPLLPTGRAADVDSSRRDDGAASALLEEALGVAYVLAGVAFVVGSIFFLKSFSAFYALGCYLYLAGGLIYLTTTCYDARQAMRENKTYEVAMNMLYVVGSGLYLLGTVCYLPSAIAIFPRATECGAWLFIVGSLFFIHACFVNGAHAGAFFSEQLPMDPRKVALARVLVLITTNSTMLGSCAFLVGSVLYLPTIGCGELAETDGTWTFVVGSLLFVLSGVLPLVSDALDLAEPTVHVHGVTKLSVTTPRGPTTPLPPSHTTPRSIDS